MDMTPQGLVGKKEYTRQNTGPPSLPCLVAGSYWPPLAGRVADVGGTAV